MAGRTIFVTRRIPVAKEKSFLALLADKKLANKELAKQTGHRLGQITSLRRGLLEVAASSPEVISQLTTAEGASNVLEQIRDKSRRFKYKHGLSDNAVGALEFVITHNKTFMTQR